MLGGSSYLFGFRVGDAWAVVFGLVIFGYGALGQRARVEIHPDRVVVQNLVRRYEVALGEVTGVEPGSTYGLMPWVPRLWVGRERSIGVSAYAPFLGWATRERRRTVATDLARALGIPLLRVTEVGPSRVRRGRP